MYVVSFILKEFCKIISIRATLIYLEFVSHQNDVYTFYAKQIISKSECDKVL